MAITLDDTKRLAISAQLAAMKALQHLLIFNDRLLMDRVNDGGIYQKFQDMLQQDLRNLDILEGVIIQYGIPGEPTKPAKQAFEKIQDLMEGNELNLSEKILQHELLKHQQTMMGLIVHKAAQIVGTDVEVAIAPLHTINFENRAHQEQLKGILEILGVCELTGQDADRGIWARGEDAIAAITGVVGSVVTRSDDEIGIRDLLLMDHHKTDILFTEILGNDEPQKIQEYFAQLYQDVKIHGLAEEQVLYPALAPYYEQMQEIVDQTDDVIERLDALKSFNSSEPDFKSQVEQLRFAVRSHIHQEEQDIFPRIKNNLSHEQQKNLASEFKAAKSELQKQQQKENSLPTPLPLMVETRTNQGKSNYPIEAQSISMNHSLPWKLIFQTKALINWVEAIVLLVGDRWIRQLLNTEPLVNSEYSQLFYGLVFIIGIGYWWVSRDISQNHAIVKLGIYAQLSVFILLANHTLVGNLHPFYLVSGILDLIFAVLFSLFLYDYAKKETSGIG